MNTGKAYSLDLRERVMAMVNAKTQLKDIAILFNIDQKTIYNWRKKFEETGDFAPRTGYQKGHSNKIVDFDMYKKFVEENSDLTLREMAEKYGNVSPQTIMRGMRRINFTFKKNNLATKKTR